MTVTIELPPAIEADMLAQAEAEGMPADQISAKPAQRTGVARSGKRKLSAEERIKRIGRLSVHTAAARCFSGSKPALRYFRHRRLPGGILHPFDRGQPARIRAFSEWRVIRPELAMSAGRRLRRGAGLSARTLRIELTRDLIRVYRYW